MTIVTLTLKAKTSIFCLSIENLISALCHCEVLFSVEYDIK